MPVLDYQSPRVQGPMLLGHPIDKLARGLLIGEAVVLFLMTTILDGGGMMRITAAFAGGLWIALAIACRVRKILPSWPVRMMFWAGILLGVAAFVMMMMG